MSVDNSEHNTSPIADVVCVRQNGLRSINVESDLKSRAVIEGYIFTAQARSCLARIINGLVDGKHSRSWTLTGPYGSGKSYFGLFLMNLLSRDQAAHLYASRLLSQAAPILAQQVDEAVHVGNSYGFLPIPVTGYRASLGECLKHGIEKVLHGLNDQPHIRSVLSEIEQWSPATRSRTIIHDLKILTDHVSELGFQGVVVVFDELGKSLEYSAAHSEQNDIYLLQEIAEFANRSAEKPFVFISILHQAFERYGALLDGSTQREWAKVQGRFEDIAFLEPPNQQMRLLVNALETDSTVLTRIAPVLHREAKLVAESGWCPPMMGVDEFVELGERAYPLHPTVIAALPYLFRRLAQNERSIFAYLASHEPFGFQQFIQLNHFPNMIQLPDLFDYISANFQARLYATGRTRVITETLERLSNANGLNALESDLLKTIGLLNWLGEVSTLQANGTSLVSALHSSDNSGEDIETALQSLVKRSKIVYRRYNQTYAIWQGSDIDIEERLQEAEKHISSAFSLAEEVQRYLPPRPMVARRHSFQTGTFRYFEVLYIDNHNRDQVRPESNLGADGFVLLCLPATINEYDIFVGWAKSSTIAKSPTVVLGIIERTSRLYELLRELRSLHWVNQNTPGLRDDVVARRELQARIAAIEVLVQNELERTFSLHRLTAFSTGRWFHAGEEVPPQPHQSMTHLLSDICDELYSCTPRLWNELLNRRGLSSQAAAARRNLLEFMLNHAGSEALGIEAYPPERSMYESILKVSGIHRQDDSGLWVFADPPDEDSLNLRPLWTAIADFIFSPPVAPRPVTDLFSLLKEPPFGLLEGVLPVFLCAFLLAHQQETTLYREGTLLPEPGVADWEVLLRRPDLFAVAGCRVDGAMQPILERLGRGLQVSPEAMPVVRALVRALRSLPEHAWRTQRLPALALASRRAIETAHSPERLLFHDLPAGLGLTPFDEAFPDSETIDLFFERLNLALDALNTATPELQARARDALLVACGFPDGDASWDYFRKIAEELVPQVNTPALRPLLQRAAQTGGAQPALESVLAFIANRPVRTWSDGDADRYFEQVQIIGAQFQAERDSIQPMARLSAEQRERCRKIAQNIHSAVSAEFGSDPRLLNAALKAMARELNDLGS